MAIWPFGRKGKRPRSQMKASDPVDPGGSFHHAADLSPVPEQGFVARKPSRKRSKRDKRRSLPSQQYSSPTRGAAEKNVDVPMPFAYNFENHTSMSSIGQDNFTVSRATPTLQKRSSTASKGSLRKRLSKRSARDVQREQEIRAMSSSPPATTWGYLPSDIRRGPSAHGRHADHYFSNHSLPMDSRSSLSDNSDHYTYKVNALAVFAPRPIIRYAENPKYTLPRSMNPSANSMRKDLKLGDEDDLHSKKRVAELADDLDAPALRELLERDRRRREKKRLENQERLQRRLQRRAEREREQEKVLAASGTTGPMEGLEDLDDLRGRDRTPSPTTSSKQVYPVDSIDVPQESVQSQEQTGSWLRGTSKESQRRSNRFSDVSAHVIGNIDDRSIRASRTGHDAEPPSKRSNHVSPSSPRINASESVSDIRTDNSEKRLSDHSSRRMTSWMSIFSRGSPRRKASRELDAPPSEFSNTSRESFSKTQGYGPGSANTPSVPIPIPERSFLRTGTIHRSQSKFTEHLGDYPISPPDSRIQSPVPVFLERVVDVSPREEQAAPRSPVDTEVNPEMEDVDRPWDASSAVLSQSLASIDSEGSWMSGKFLRRISQNPNYSGWRNSTGKSKLDKYDEDDEVASDEYFTHLSGEDKRNSEAGLRRASSTAMGLEGAESDGSSSDSKGVTAWHGGLARKPTVVRREVVRAQSREIILNDADTSMEEASPISPVSPVSPVSQGDDDVVQIQRAKSVDYGRASKHARHMSAGSVKLLDIGPRPSVDSKGSLEQGSAELI